MESSTARVLILANKTAATPALLDAVRERAARGPAKFTLLVPNSHGSLQQMTSDDEDMGHSDADQTIALAKPLIEEAAGAEIDTMVGEPSPLDAAMDAVNLHGFDEIIVSTLPHRVSRWLHLDLPSKLTGLGLPVTTVTPGE